MLERKEIIQSTAPS